MTNFLLFLILVALAAINFQLRQLLKLNDLSKEDASVKAMTEEVEKAKQRLPKEK